MSQLQKYKIIVKTLYENDSTIVSRAKADDGSSVIIKRLKSSAWFESNLMQYRNEYNILSSLNSKYTPEVVDFVESATECFLVFKNIDAISLERYIEGKKLEILEFLDLAIEVSKAIVYLHEKHIIHTDINPKNIIFNKESKKINIIDFGSATNRDKLYSSIYEKLFPTNLYYISPEQTRQTSFDIDYRSDLYSFGLTLYTLLSNSLPFSADDKYELVHKQLAINPKPLDEIRDDIPKYVVKMIEKLIQKNPAKRYQSTEVLLKDLQKAKEFFIEKKDAKDFVISEVDIININNYNKIVGRDKELSLFRSYTQDRELKSANISISGISGVGKSRFSEEVIKELNKKNVSVIRFKFDQYNNSQPYALFKAISIEMSLILADRVSDKSFFEKIYKHAHLIAHFFPELSYSKKLVGKIDENFSINRLPYAFASLLKLLFTNENPLYIYIDDVQWADEASLALMMKVDQNSSDSYLNTIISYRANEIHYNQKAELFVKYIESQESTFNVRLKELSEENVYEFLENIFSSDMRDELQELAKILFVVSEGNPFYIRYYTQYFLDLALITNSSNGFKFDFEKIKKSVIDRDISGVIQLKLKKLNANELDKLQYIALLGSNISDEIASVFLKEIDCVDEDIHKFISIDMLVLEGQRYTFVHDKVQEVIMDSISEDKKEKMHLKLAHFLEREYKNAKLESIVDAVLEYLNAYKDEFPKRLIPLYIKAIDEMMSKNAYSLALQTLTQLKKHYKVESFKNLKLSARVYYLNRLHDEALRDILELKKIAKTMSQKLEVFALYKDLSVTKGSGFEDVIAFADELMYEFNLKNSKSSVDEELEYLESKIESHKLYENPKALLKHKKLLNKRENLLLQFLLDYWESCFYLSDLKQMRWSYLKIVESSFYKGNSSASTLAYTLFAMELVGKKSYKKASLFADVALKLNYLFDDEQMRPKVHNFVANFIHPYTHPFSENLELYEISLKQSRVNGDIVFGTWANFLMHFSDYLSGTNLFELSLKISNEESFILNSGDAKMIAIFSLLKDEIEYLKTGEKRSADESIKMFESENFPHGLTWYSIIKAQTLLLLGKIEEGVEVLRVYAKSDANEVIMFPKIRLHFIRAILLLSLKRDLSDLEKSSLKRDLSEFKSYIKASKSTFKVESLLLQVLENRKSYSTWESASILDSAIYEARKIENSFLEAISTLISARFFDSKNYQDIRDSYLKRSYVSLDEWGAKELVVKLKEQYQVKSREVTPSSLKNSSLLHLQSRSNLMDESDSKNILKAFQAISSAKSSSDVLEMLMSIILETAYANRAILFVKEHGQFVSKVKLDFSTSKITLDNTPLLEGRDIPKSLLLYAINIKERLFVENPKDDDRFSLDEYFYENSPASLNVIPAFIEGELTTLLYLENSKLSTILDDIKIETLELFLTQSSIVLSNLNLISKLSIADEQLNKAQQIGNIGSWIYNTQTKQIEWSAQTYRIYNMEPFEKEITAKWLLSHIPKDDLLYVRKELKEVLYGKNDYKLSHRIITIDNKEKMVKQNAEVVLKDGVKIIVGTVQDVTDQVLKDKLFLMQTRQAQMGELLSMIAHQWRQPLAIINTMLSQQRMEMMLSEELSKLDISKNITNTFEKIEFQIQHLSQTINDFRGFFKSDKKAQNIKVSYMIKEAISLLEHSLAKNKISVNFDFKEDIIINTYAHEVEQVFLNLIKNSIDAFLETDTKDKKIDIKSFVDEKNVMIIFKDSAGGIREDMLDTLFLPYVSSKDEQNGTGLGLYMSKTIIEDHCSGSISVKNSDGGAEFTIILPLEIS